MKSLYEYIIESVRPGHKLGTVKKINGLSVQEGAWVIFLDGYEDPNDKSKAIELIGKVEDIELNDVLVKIGDKKKMISNNDIVGIMYSYEKTVDDGKIFELEDRVSDIEEEVDDLIDQITQLQNDMEEDIMQQLQSEAEKRGYDEDSEDYDRLRDLIGSEWADDSGYNNLEKELEKKRQDLAKARKNLEDYKSEDGKTVYKTKYKKGYNGKYEYSLEKNGTQRERPIR